MDECEVIGIDDQNTERRFALQSNLEKQKHNYHFEKKASQKFFHSDTLRDRPIDSKFNNVPIYQIKSQLSTIHLKFDKQSKYFAYGEFIGKFRQSSQLKNLQNVSFLGKFEGIFDWTQMESEGVVFFQGNIHEIQFLTRSTEKIKDQELESIFDYENEFYGYFKGTFYDWSAVGGKSNIIPNRLVFLDQSHIKSCFLKKQNCIQEVKKNLVKKQKEQKQYQLPTLVRFEILNVGDINLSKCSAVVNGNLFVEVKYNDTIEEMINQRRKDPHYGQKMTISISFNREHSLFLPLYEQDDESEDSQWSIQDKDWDIQFKKNEKKQLLQYKILKRFKAEIDNSYGGFFAPFSLNKVRIVVSFAPVYLNENTKLKFYVADTDEYGNDYDPFIGFNDLGTHANPREANNEQMNRLYKINAKHYVDNGQYKIADNYLTIYPHFKTILENKGLISSDILWNLGIRDFKPLLEPPQAKGIIASFKRLKAMAVRQGKINSQKYLTFGLLKWNKAIIEIPMYKYIVIDMIKIFVPLVIITVINLLIFQQENGIGTSSSFTTLAARLVNIASLEIVYVSMIPVIRSSLPTMPGITLIEILTYLLTIPSILATINSMLYYTIPESKWKQTYVSFNDQLFLSSLLISLLCFIVLSSVFVVYWGLDYNSVKLKKPIKFQVKWRSPKFTTFIQSMKDFKKDFYTINELIS